MFKGLILKSVIRDNIHLLIPKVAEDKDIMIIISHGSGGIGLAEYNTANYFLSKGYTIGILDYFSKWSISTLRWNYEEKFRDNFNVTFKKMLLAHNFLFDKKVVHIGFSLGGFLGILNSKYFFKNFCFYPGIVGFTENIINQDYTNTTIFNAVLDRWCSSKEFISLCSSPPSVINVNAYHGFMIPGKDKLIPIAKYNLPNAPITEKEFSKIKPNHEWLDKKYGHISQEIRLQYDKNSCIMCLNYIEKELCT